jgi:hypothetical protein
MIDPDGSIQGPWGVKLLDCTINSIYKGAKHFARRSGEQELVWVGGGGRGRGRGRRRGRGRGRWGGEEVGMRMLKIREIYTS